MYDLDPVRSCSFIDQGYETPSCNHYRRAFSMRKACRCVKSPTSVQEMQLWISFPPAVSRIFLVSCQTLAVRSRECYHHDESDNL